MSEYHVGRIRAASNIEVHEGVEISDVDGQRRLERITLRSFNPDGTATKTDAPSETLNLSAVFVFIGAEPGCGWLPPGIVRDSLGYILTGTDAFRSGRWPLTDREPCPLE